MMMGAQEIGAIATAAGAIAAAVGVWVAVRQVSQAKVQSQSQFEDSLVEHYRAVIANVPLDALLGRHVDSDDQRIRRAFYDYFELSNEQAFLAARGRIRAETWANWKEGIEQHMARPAFAAAWKTLVSDLDGSFDAFKDLLPTELLTGVSAHSLKSGSGISVQIGYTNPNGQRCLGHRDVPGTDHLQLAYKTECTHCGMTYGANGSDMHLRRCPSCQSGAPGLPF